MMNTNKNSHIIFEYRIHVENYVQNETLKCEMVHRNYCKFALNITNLGSARLSSHTYVSLSALFFLSLVVNAQ